MSRLRRMANAQDPASFSSRMRQKRFALFQHLIAPLPRPLSILDVGGTERFWETMGLIDDPGIELHLLNIHSVASGERKFIPHVGDARHMPEFEDGRFDIVFSNSVIEHVGGLAEQKRMADEVRRVGRRYFVQTPNRYFPIEPHFLIPFFQFLPQALKVMLLRHLKGIRDEVRAAERAREITLISRRQLQAMFPDARIYEERFALMAKSFVAYAGWPD